MMVEIRVSKQKSGSEGSVRDVEVAMACLGVVSIIILQRH